MGRSGSKIGLLGGTFNPIHFGHLQTAQTVLDRLNLDRILFIPTGKTPHKKGSDLPSGTDRLNMIRLALKGHASFKPCDIEIKRPGISYTIDTLFALKRRHPKDTFFFIVGTDAFFNLPTWKEPEKLLKLCPFVIVPRAGNPFLRLPDLSGLESMDTPALKQLDLKRRMRYTFVGPSGTKLYFIRTPAIAVTASEIRSRIKTNKSVQSLLPQEVLSYIIKKRLYKKEDHS